jgi:hypothetical protein
MRYEEYYAELGKLLYAVADVDRVVSKEEKEKIYGMIRDELVAREKNKDRFGTNLTNYAQIEFDYLNDEDVIVDPTDAFNSFVDFVERHYTAFNPEMMKICLHIAKVVAEAYHGINRKEAQMISELERKLKKILAQPLPPNAKM